MKYRQIINSPNALLEISKGNIDGYSLVTFIGKNTDVDTSLETISSIAPAYPASAETYYVSSDDDSDAVDVEITGLDADWETQTVTQTLNGQTKTEVGSSVTWRRIFSVKNVGATDLAGDVYIYIDDTVTDGVPDNAVKIRTKTASNKSFDSIYTVPSGYTAFILNWHFSSICGTSAVLTGELQVREFGKVFQIYDMGNCDESSEYEHKCTYCKVDAKSDIRIQCKSSAENLEVKASFSIILVDNNYLVI